MNAVAEAAPPGKLRTVVTYLAMETPPEDVRPPAPLPGIAIRRRRAMPAADYLRLYHAIGDDWLWWSRLLWDEATLAAHLAAEETEVYVAEADGEEIGLIELDLRPAPDIELRYFGVIPSRIGTGLGGWLLAHATRGCRVAPPAAAHDPQHLRLWTTPVRSPSIGKHGFAVTHSEVEIVDDPRLVGLLPRDAGPHVPLAQPARS